MAVLTPDHPPVVDPDRSSPVRRSTPGGGRPRPGRLAVVARVVRAVGATMRETPERRTPGSVTLMSTSLAILGLLLLSFAAELTVVGGLRHARAQATAYDALRSTLANAVTPVGPRTDSGALVAMGTPVALIQVPAIGLKEVVLEGTTSGVLRSGVGHRRDTAMPGQPGVSILFGRTAAYGGPFGRIGQLRAGDAVVITTGQGRQTFSVSDVRRAGDPAPAPLSGAEGMVSLQTADGPAFAPTGVLRVDARLMSLAQPRPPAAFVAGQVPQPELAMSGDPSALMPLLLWCQALLVASVVLAWARIRWGGWQTWVVGLPTLLLVTIQVADHASALLPNLL